MKSPNTGPRVCRFVACLVAVVLAAPQVLSQSSTEQAGFHIRGVRLGWPAQRAGLETGDVITKVNGDAIVTEGQFTKAVKRAAEGGREIELTLIDVRTGRELIRRMRPSLDDGKLGVFYRFVEPAIGQKIRDLFRSKGFSPETFPSRAFDPEEQDPLPFYIKWEGLRSDLEALLKRELGLEAHPYLTLTLVEEKGKKNVCRYVFSKQRPEVRRVLEQALPLNDQSFSEMQWRPVVMTVQIATTTFLADYRNADGNLSFSKVESALVNYRRPGQLEDVAVTPIRDGNKYVYVRSSWVQAKELRTATGRYYYRLVQGVKRHESERNLWILFVRFDIVWLPNSEHNPDIRRRDSSDANPDLANLLSVSVGKERKTVTNQVTRMTPYTEGTSENKMAEEITVVSVAERSSLLAIGRTILKDTEIKLCGKPITR